MPEFAGRKATQEAPCRHGFDCLKSGQGPRTMICMTQIPRTGY